MVFESSCSSVIPYEPRISILLQKIESASEVSKEELIDVPQTSSSSSLQSDAKHRQLHVEPCQKWSVRLMNQETDGSDSVRYDLPSLLPKLRFLLPLCNQRWRLVQELLHTTELSAPDYMPVILVDRRVPLIERHADLRSSVFQQVYQELRGEKLHFRLVTTFTSRESVCSNLVYLSVFPLCYTDTVRLIVTLKARKSWFEFIRISLQR